MYHLERGWQWKGWVLSHVLSKESVWFHCDVVSLPWSIGHPQHLLWQLPQSLWHTLCSLPTSSTRKSSTYLCSVQFVLLCTKRFYLAGCDSCSGWDSNIFLHRHLTDTTAAISLFLDKRIFEKSMNLLIFFGIYNKLSPAFGRSQLR